MRAVFLDQQTFANNVSLRNIESCVNSLVSYPITTPEQVIPRCKDMDIIITNKVIIDEQTMQQLPQLKLICIAATGTNNVNLVAAKKCGIAVTNVSGYAKNSVAQYVFSQLLAYFSNTSHHNKNVVSGLWQQSPTFCLHGDGSHELAGKTIGIIGYGDLGQSVATIAKAFDMNILIAERRDSVTPRSGRTSFDKVIQQSDILSLHCPLTNDTHNLIAENEFNNMKKNAVLVNTARGNIVNESDLLDALNNNQIAYAILDVLAQEPPSSHHPLINAKLNNLKITAHIAWASIEAQQRLLNIIATNIIDFTQNKLTNRVA